jgi:DNA-binding response OmpR family regulator
MRWKLEVSHPPEIFRFGPYEARLRTQELFKHERRLKLQPQAFQVLTILLDRPGELVTRRLATILQSCLL